MQQHLMLLGNIYLQQTGSCRNQVVISKTFSQWIILIISIIMNAENNRACDPWCILHTGNIRNLAMEKVASTVHFPCKYSTSGCTVTLLHTNKTDHEDACEFRPYACPCPGALCKWQGALEHVMPHLMSVHKSITTLQGDYQSPSLLLLLQSRSSQPAGNFRVSEGGVEEEPTDWWI